MYRYIDFADDPAANNDHNLYCSVPLISIFSLDDAAALRGKYAADGESSTTEHSGFPMDRYCKCCWLLNSHKQAFESEDEAIYHMKAKCVRCSYYRPFIERGLGLSYQAPHGF